MYINIHVFYLLVLIIRYDKYFIKLHVSVNKNNYIVHIRIFYLYKIDISFI